ncbi:MAG: M48 family metallopeptidase [Lentisphaerae bacterium]|nr:M48 family metallopeptidase [Lentisphaerota bacterium]
MKNHMVIWRHFARVAVIAAICAVGQSCTTEVGHILMAGFAEQAGTPGRVALQISNELQQLGIDGFALLLKVQATPSAFYVSVPEHEQGRKRIILLDREDERRIGDAVIAEMKTHGAFYNDAKQEKRVRKIAQRINKVLPEPLPLNIYLQKDEQVNAACLLDGSVFVTSGLLKAITDDQQLAAVLAHEYGHAVARHGSENVTKMLMQSAGETVIAETLAARSDGGGKAGVLIMASYGLGSKYGVLLPYSRTMEYEADRLGTLYMARAGYDPNAMIKVFEMFQKMSPGDNVFSEFLSTHPMNQKRIDNVRLVIANEIR